MGKATAIQRRRARRQRRSGSRSLAERGYASYQYSGEYRAWFRAQRKSNGTPLQERAQ